MREYNRPMFSKRHYEDAAHDLKYWGDGKERLAIARFLIELFSGDNYKFDPYTFLKAADLLGPAAEADELKRWV